MKKKSILIKVVMIFGGGWQRKRIIEGDSGGEEYD